MPLPWFFIDSMTAPDPLAVAELLLEGVVVEDEAVRRWTLDWPDDGC